MKKIKTKFKNIWLAGFIFLLSFILPDFIIFKNFATLSVFNLTILGYGFFLSLFIVSIKNNFIYWILSIFILLITYTNYYFYLFFGRLYLSSDISLFFTQIGDTFNSFFVFFFKNLLVALGFILSFLLLFIVSRLRKKIKRSNFVILPIILIYSFIPYRFLKKRDYFATPTLNYYTFFNSLKSVNAFIIEEFFIKQNTFTNKDIRPYKIETIKQDDKQPVTVILIMGESWNPSHFSLYGYKRNTTPLLKKLFDENKLHISLGISSGVSTLSSVFMFFNLLHTIDNIDMFKKQTSNLFKLAKEKKFKNYYITTQNISSSFKNTGEEWIDSLFFREKNISYVDKKGDDVWLEKFKNLQLTNKNFITIQTRLTHDPYKNYWIHKGQEFNKFNDKKVDTRINDYDNAVLYLDSLLYKLIEYASTIKGKVYVIITSDHGELLGEKNLWGHNNLNLDNAKVPFILWTKDVLPSDLIYIKSLKIISHWEIGKFVASILGYKITDPNNSDNIFTINYRADNINRRKSIIFKRSFSNGKFILTEKLN